MIIYAMFNISNQEVEIFTEEEWLDFILPLIEEMGDAYEPNTEINEVLEYFWGDEVWYSYKELK